jgi:hypothetical protein
MNIRCNVVGIVSVASAETELMYGSKNILIFQEQIELNLTDIRRLMLKSRVYQVASIHQRHVNLYIRYQQILHLRRILSKISLENISCFDKLILRCNFT